MSAADAANSFIVQLTKHRIRYHVDIVRDTVQTGAKTSVIHATQHHLFWDATRHAWTEADRLSAGDALRTDDGTFAAVTSTLVVTGAADMWDLTVVNDDDFYMTPPPPTSSSTTVPIEGRNKAVENQRYRLGTSTRGVVQIPASPRRGAATQIMNDHYGEGNWLPGASSEYSRIVKYISRHG